MTTRYKTRAIVIIHSHVVREGNNGVIDVSKDVIALSTSKSIKGAGGFNITLVPRKNYLNYIFPNDVVNIYIDPGDGKRGFVRTMFGYVDRINRSISVGDNGQTSTTFQIVGTDFTKAFDMTQIYFNPHLANRAEFLKDFGLSQLGGGHALRTRGISAHGTPAELVENLVQLMMGFGSQWVLPISYPFRDKKLQDARNKRIERAKARLPKDINNKILEVFGAPIEQVLLDTDVESQLLEVAAGFNQNITAYTAREAALADLLQARTQLASFQYILNQDKNRNPSSLMDLLSLDFIESLAIDGYIAATAIWTQQGTLASILYGWSNEIVNELCFDLRPVAQGKDECFGDGSGNSTKYSIDADELGYNVTGSDLFPKSVVGIKYVPSLVFREYPYSVVEGLDLSHYNVLGTPAGKMQFGPVFSTKVGETQRNYYKYANSITPERCFYADTAKPLKHIDVITIENTDVIKEEIGRSDHDTHNMYALYSQDALGKFWKFLIQDFMPIITPVSILRHGLRVQEMQTKFANYPRDKVCGGTQSSGVDTSQTRRNLIRWALLFDHWNQHNIEYLNGTVELRGMPEIRVGYRLDWLGRNESYYVESVQHSWAYPGEMRTTLQLSRGQRNDPFPSYIPPIVVKNTTGVLLPGEIGPVREIGNTLVESSFAIQGGGGKNRDVSGRLADFFTVNDTKATAFAVGGEQKFTSGDNIIDKPNNSRYSQLGQVEYSGQVATQDTVPTKEQIDNLFQTDNPPNTP